MKHLAIVLFLIELPILCFAQQTINGFIIHDEIQREYILYVPANYTGNSAVPLVLNFHGYGSNANGQMNYGDFRSISDNAGFLIVHPEGTLFQGVTHWNVGGWTVGSTVDDVGFTEALIESLSSEYNIDQDRVYSTGMSNGGFMSFLLASQLSDRIAAIASITGSMTPETYTNSDPHHPIPILQMHGTSDSVVPYTGTTWSEPVADVLQYWQEYNNCNYIPEITALPDLDPNDGSTVELHVFEDGDNGVSVEHYKVIGGGHTWPGNVYGGVGTNNDIDASEEIWNFFARYDINGLINAVGIEEDELPVPASYSLSNYPNPFNPTTTILIEFSSELHRQNELLELVIYNIKGQKIKDLTGEIYTLSSRVPSNSGRDEGRQSIIWNGTDNNDQPVQSGVYYYRFRSASFNEVKKMLLLK
jgi:polyhydroxybutyrate depolymerase